MKWESLLSIVGDEPFFRPGLLLVGSVRPEQVRLQLARWVRSGRLVMVGRGLYTAAATWRKSDPHPFELANALRPGSYVSLQSALAYHGLIPEHVATTTSVGPGRPGVVSTAIGDFQFRWVHPGMRFGYTAEPVAPGRTAFVASPEKALLDLIHLTPGGDRCKYLQELRLDPDGKLDRDTLTALARRSGKPKLIRAAERAGAMLEGQAGAAR
ncbi:MAG: hypothetical protein FJX72_20855 [Armatimonadetes bacterium]|nr:hypothetical protein [Armatimonadota bacterium]